MIAYNVTINMDSSIHEEWVQWMQDKHLAEVMGTGKFVGYRMYRVLSPRDPDEQGFTYSMQYVAKSMADYEEYRDEHAPRLQLDGQQRFGDKMSAFRSLMEVIQEGTSKD